MTTYAVSKSESVEKIKKHGKGMHILNDNLIDAANVDLALLYKHTKHNSIDIEKSNYI